MGQVEIEDRAGAKAVIQGVSTDERRVIARTSDESLVQIPVQLLRIKNPKSYQFDGVFADLFDPSPERSEDRHFPVIEEQVQVTKSKVDTGEVRIRKSVQERTQSVPVELTIEEVNVERLPMDEIVDSPRQPRQEGDTYIFAVQEEILVVEKKILIREEVRISTRKRVETKEISERLRSEDVHVERKSLKKN